MPYCCVPNCRSRTSGMYNPYTNFYSFPKQEELQAKWLEACHRKKGELKLNCATVCERHFKADCIEERLTKPRSANIKPRIMRRLKRGSIPTEALTLPKLKTLRGLKHSLSGNSGAGPQETTNSVSIIPSYAELIASAKAIKDEQVTSTARSKDPKRIPGNVVSFASNEIVCQVDIKQEEIDINESGDPTRIDQLMQGPSGNNAASNKQIESLRDQIRKLERENEDLKKQLQQKSKIIIYMKKNMHKTVELKTKNVLSKVFTPGQVQKLLSPHGNRVKWTAEDISSAIALRSISTKVYKYLREVKNVPLPCTETLRIWSASSNMSPE